jgi:hypothetical protein
MSVAVVNLLAEALLLPFESQTELVEALLQHYEAEALIEYKDAAQYAEEC